MTFNCWITKIKTHWFLPLFSSMIKQSYAPFILPNIGILFRKYKKKLWYPVPIISPTSLWFGIIRVVSAELCPPRPDWDNINIGFSRVMPPIFRKSLKGQFTFTSTSSFSCGDFQVTGIFCWTTCGALVFLNLYCHMIIHYIYIYMIVVLISK